MKNQTLIIITVVLALSIGFTGFTYARLSNQITSLKSAGISAPSNVATPTPTSLSMVNLIPLVQPTIVRIDVTGSGFQASGSGIIIRQDGYVITNQHVIDKENAINVIVKDGQQYSATVTASDSTLDLAILHLTGSPANLSTATIGSTSDIIIGSNVTAAGYPLGLDLPGPASFTRGIISAIRTLDTQKYIQTDVAINPGSSGGALVINNGKLIGITTAAVVPQGLNAVGIGLAIPIDVIQTYIQNNLK
jgi:S1-C subfamily serine protease